MESHQHPESFSRGNRILMISFHAFHLGSFLCFVVHFYTYALSPLICNTMLHLNLLYSKMWWFFTILYSTILKSIFFQLYVFISFTNHKSPVLRPHLLLSHAYTSLCHILSPLFEVSAVVQGRHFSALHRVSYNNTTSWESWGFANLVKSLWPVTSL